jgi:hypothetical protein
MAISPTRLTTTGDTTLYTSIGGTNAITLIIVCNTGLPNPSNESENSCTLQLNLVPFGSGSSDSNAIVKNLVVPAGETIFFSEERVVLGEGDSLRGRASSSNLLTITVSTIGV